MRERYLAARQADIDVLRGIRPDPADLERTPAALRITPPIEPIEVPNLTPTPAPETDPADAPAPMPADAPQPVLQD